MAVVLVVDDEEPIRKLVCSMLTKAGHRHFEAANGLEGVAVFKANARLIDLVITDVRMPVMGGAEAVARMRETRADIPVLFMSGYSDQEIPPGTALLSKPFRSSDLIDAVNQLLAG